MRQYVIGNDIDDIYWDIYSKQDVPEDLNSADITNLALSATHKVVQGVRIAPTHEVEGLNRLKIKFTAENIIRLGVYDLELTYKKADALMSGGMRSCRVTYCDAFEVVAKSCEVDVPVDPLVIAGIIGPLRGYSAYEVAVKNGFIGTEDEWIAWLRQPAIDAAGVALEAAQNAQDQADYIAGLDLVTAVLYSDIEYPEI